MARMKTVVWNNFAEVKVDGTQRAKFKNCGDDILANAEKNEKALGHLQQIRTPPSEVMKQSTILDAVTSKEKIIKFNCLLANILLQTIRHSVKLEVKLLKTW